MTDMTLERAFEVAELASPLPSMAAEALRCMRDRIREMEAARLVPGVMRCAKCNFVVNRVSLNVRSGTITAGDSKTEPCPNGCGPLWPVTWEQDARECMQRLEAAHDRIREMETFVPGAPKHGDDAGDGLRYVLCKVGFGDHYRDWLLIPHADGQYVTAAKLQPFSMAILQYQLAATAPMPEGQP